MAQDTPMVAAASTMIPHVPFELYYEDTNEWNDSQPDILLAFQIPELKPGSSGILTPCLDTPSLFVLAGALRKI